MRNGIDINSIHTYIEKRRDRNSMAVERRAALRGRINGKLLRKSLTDFYFTISPSSTLALDRERATERERNWDAYILVRCGTRCRINEKMNRSNGEYMKNPKFMQNKIVKIFAQRHYLNNGTDIEYYAMQKRTPTKHIPDAYIIIFCFFYLFHWLLFHSYAHTHARMCAVDTLQLVEDMSELARARTKSVFNVLLKRSDPK